MCFFCVCCLFCFFFLVFTGSWVFCILHCRTIVFLCYIFFSGGWRIFFLVFSRIYGVYLVMNIVILLIRKLVPIYPFSNFVLFLQSPIFVVVVSCKTKYWALLYLSHLLLVFLLPVGSNTQISEAVWPLLKLFFRDFTFLVRI